MPPPRRQDPPSRDVARWIRDRRPLGGRVQDRRDGRDLGGVWGTGRNGPDGWNRIDHDLKFPVHGQPNGRPYAVIARLGAGGGYFYVGSTFPADPARRQLHVAPAQRLSLRTNDDTPGNGSRREPGACFRCQVRVWR